MATFLSWRAEADRENADISPMDRRIQTSWFTPPRLAAIALSVVIAAAGTYGYVHYGITRTLSIDAQLLREQIMQLDRAVAGLNANLDLARQNLENLVIKAPIGGHLTSLEAHYIEL